MANRVETEFLGKVVRISKGGYSVTVKRDKYDQWKAGGLIQWVFPELSPDEREFMMSGLTPDEWSQMFDGNE